MTALSVIGKELIKSSVYKDVIKVHDQSIKKIEDFLAFYVKTFDDDGNAEIEIKNKKTRTPVGTELTGEVFWEVDESEAEWWDDDSSYHYAEPLVSVENNHKELAVGFHFAKQIYRFEHETFTLTRPTGQRTKQKLESVYKAISKDFNKVKTKLIDEIKRIAQKHKMEVEVSDDNTFYYKGTPQENSMYFFCGLVVQKAKSKSEATFSTKEKVEARLELATSEDMPKNISQMKKLKPGTKIKLVKGDKRGFYHGRFEKGKEYELMFVQGAMIFNSEVGMQAINYPKKTEVEFTEKGFILKPRGLAVSWTPEEFELTKVVY